MPFQLSGIRIQRNNAVGVKIVTGIPRSSIPPWVGIAGPPERQIGFRIVRTGHPNRRASVLPRISRPRLIARFARFCDGLETPHLVSRVHVERRDPTVHAELVRRWTEDHFVFHHEWGDVELQTLFPVDERLVPNRLAAFRIDGNQVAVVGRPEQPVAGHR